MKHEAFGFFLFISGYALGRIDSIIGFFKKTKPYESFIDKVNEEQKKEKKKVSIDDTKIVTKVLTDTFKKNGKLGDKLEVKDNISSAAEKLVKLKKKKG